MPMLGKRREPSEELVVLLAWLALSLFVIVLLSLVWLIVAVCFGDLGFPLERWFEL